MWTAIALIVATLGAASAIALYFQLATLQYELRSCREALDIHIRVDNDTHNALDTRLTAIGKEAEKRLVPRRKDTPGVPMVPTDWETVQAAFAANPDNYKEQA